MTAAEKLDFESILSKLESLVEQMENTETDLEDSLGAFEEGIGLTRKAQKILSDAEQRVQILLDEKGEMTTEKFPGDEDSE